MKEEDLDIDFVVPWVDGSDSRWREEFNRYAPDAEEGSEGIDARSERYRDYGTLKYWFRGVQKFAPWVRRVHFITNGQKPSWLNTANPKLHWVKHKDYIPAEYLPVFSSHPIELYMHKIGGLAERFVYFNDDFFLIDYVDKGFFFKKGLPVDSAVTAPLSVLSSIAHIQLNNVLIINKFFNKREVVKNNLTKWYNLKYKGELLRTVFVSPWPNFTGFNNPHFAQPYTKTLLNEVWEAAPRELERTMRSRFRSVTDVNQWLFRYWNLCKGDFYPENPRKGKKFFVLTDENEGLYGAIRGQKYKQIAVNEINNRFGEKEEITKARDVMQSLREAFDSILPEKSDFEI